MKLRQKIFCDSIFIEKVLEERKNRSRPHMIAYQIMLRFGDIYVDLSKEELKKAIRENDFYKKIFKSENRGIHSAPNWKFRFNFEKVTDEVLFITENTFSDELNVLRKKYGCLIISSDNDIHYLERLCRDQNFSLIPSKRRFIFQKHYNNSWKDVFKKGIEPINAAIINDNYIFSDKYDERARYSLYPLLEAIIPKHLDSNTDFHLTFFHCNDKGIFTQQKAIDIINDLKKLNLSDNIKISIVSHTQKEISHDRLILTNYHYITSGKGFSVIDKEGVKETVLGSCNCIFHSIDSISSEETIKHKHDYILEWLKDIFNNHINDNKNCFVEGDSIVNRLLYS